jgi:predicted KAP-like P-loop ATPase
MISDDSPIRTPGEDSYGIAPFAEFIARSIESMASPEGAVIAINGPWGSGKSSVINLALHHLKPACDAGMIKVVKFSPWWFSGAESLTLAFFEELEAAFEKVTLDSARNAARRLGKRLSPAAPVVEALADLAGYGLVAKVASAAAGALGQEQSVEAAHAALTKALREQSARFLVVIDDIDRLGPDEALLVFRLAKSVGKLPNVVYLLAFDQSVAEQIIDHHFPGEGASYLEKIVQKGFDIPLPDADELRDTVKTAVERLGCWPEERKVVRFMNLFYDVVSPYLRTPRNVVRLISTVAVTWPAVRGDVDPADFLSLEALRLFEPAVFRAIRANPDKLCGASDRDQYGVSRDQRAATYDALLLGQVAEDGKEQMRRALMRLFPRLGSCLEKHALR